MILITLSSALITILITSAIIIISSILANKNILDWENKSPFECGFEPNGSAQIPFSLRVFLVTNIFLIYGIEITLHLPIASLLNTSNITTISLSGTFFLVVLLNGLYHEWNQGALNWNE